MAEGLHLAYRFVADRDLAVTRRYGLVHAHGGPSGEDVPRPATAGDRAALATLVAAFASARERAVKILRGLDDAGWRREGVSPSRGPLSVETYATTMDAHDTEHLGQIQDVRAALGLPPKRCE